MVNKGHKVKLIILAGLGAAFLTGCAGSGFFPASQSHNVTRIKSATHEQVQPQAEPQVLRYSQDHLPHVDNYGALRGGNGAAIYQSPSDKYKGPLLTKHIGHYVQGLTQELMSNMEYVSDKTPVGITNFAMLNGDLQETNLFGLQMAESFIHELHKFRIPVIDFKATDYIRVTKTGDFFLSRDFLELKERAPLDFVLTGTMTKHQGGYLINARIIGLQTKEVVSSAQTVIPFYVVEALLDQSHSEFEGVKLIQGE